ncbi:hypothetical protein OpiT1DRAFT_02271 [Opitutaceae bacterium TAV1]|nr:hypothetical protein OpiT1DRAFT_02271 [Opitutaceae bacterium TAV1]
MKTRSLIASSFTSAVVAAFAMFTAVAPCAADTLWLPASDATATTNQIAMIKAERGIEANGARILQLQSFADGPHQASFRFLVQKPGTYKIWASTTPQTAGWASPFLVLVDGKLLGTDTGTAAKSLPVGSTRPIYGLANNPGLFQWFCFGETALEAGEHEVTFQITTRRAAREARGQAFAFYLDSLLVTDDAALAPSGPRAKETAEGAPR